MWEKIWRNEIIDIFQMDSTVGKQSLSLVKPVSIPQMAAVNSLMRLIPEFTAYDVPHANKIRKIIAKKKMREINSARAEYFQTGAERGVSEDILKYI